MEPLIGVIKNYAWGSLTHLAELRGEQFSVLPEAEMWFGAHAVGSATLPSRGGMSLLAAIEADPAAELGPDIDERFDGRLPFLLKLLAADVPLSVQVHPSASQAKAGFAAENEAGLSIDDPTRTFRDDNHKPELIVALSRFEALIGFDDSRSVLELLDLLAVDELGEIRNIIETSGTAAAIEPVVSLDDAVLRTITSTIAVRADQVAGTRASDAALLGRIAREFPGDPGVLMALLLNRVILRPGEGVYLGAGVMHAYVNGFGVEVMANCDNVVRGGLTKKHIDIETLVEIVDPDGGKPDIVRPSGDVTIYDPPAPEFTLTRLFAPNGWSRTPGGPEIVLAVEGSADVTRGGETISLAPTESAWLRPGLEPYEVRSAGVVFVAAVGTS